MAENEAADAADSERPTSATFDGEDFLFHLYRGSELLQDNCVAEAKEELERAMALQPRDIEGQGLLGVVYFRLGLYPRAIQIYEDIIKLCPTELTPRVNLALCYLKTGQPTPAREALEEVVRRGPDHTRAWGYLGLVFDRLGDYTKALAAFERASQPHMVRRMQQLIDSQESRADSSPPEHAELRAAAADAVQELDGEEHPRPFTAIDASEASGAPSRSGRWRATEPGEEVVPPPSRRSRPPTLPGRFGPAVPALGVPELAVEPKLAPTAPTSVSTLASQALLPLGDERRVLLEPGGNVIVRVEAGFTARVDALRALSPSSKPFRSNPVRRRTRGRELDEPLGGLGAPLVLLEGSGNLVLRARENRQPLSLELGDDFLYVREEQLLGFELGVRHENGRLSTGGGDNVAMIQLSGRGAVVIEAKRALRTLEVVPERPISVRVDDVVGWIGRLLAHPLGQDEAPGAAHGFVGFSGDGRVLLDFG